MTAANENLLSTPVADGAVCAPEVLMPPWVGADPFEGYGPGASMGDTIPVGSPRQGAIPDEYRNASAEELDARIEAAKATPGAHASGQAADVACNGQEAYKLLKLALELGFTGIGVNQKGGGRFIHLDTLTQPPRPNVWSY